MDDSFGTAPRSDRGGWATSRNALSTHREYSSSYLHQQAVSSPIPDTSG
eukprot:gene9307-14390_t